MMTFNPIEKTTPKSPRHTGAEKFKFYKFLEVNKEKFSYFTGGEIVEALNSEFGITITRQTALSWARDAGIIQKRTLFRDHAKLEEMRTHIKSLAFAIREIFMDQDLPLHPGVQAIINLYIEED